MIDEFELVDRLANTFPPASGVNTGIGDDAAVLESGRFDLVTMDTLVEGVHFRGEFSEPGDVGWKAVAVNLSDIAAMGGTPGALFVSLAVPSATTEAWIDGFCAGMREAMEELVPDGCEVSVAGGDLSESRDGAVVTGTLLGTSPPTGAVLRKGASAGDRIFVVGDLGRSAAGLAALGSGEVDVTEVPGIIAIHRRPRPPVEAGIALGAESIPSAMLDVSDGLVQDLGHILDASEVGARIDLSDLDVDSELVTLQRREIGRIEDWILAGGEDFCLLMTVPTECCDALRELAADRGWDVCDVGAVTPPQHGLRIRGVEGTDVDAAAQGFRHFGNADE